MCVCVCVCVCVSILRIHLAYSYLTNFVFYTIFNLVSTLASNSPSIEEIMFLNPTWPEPLVRENLLPIIPAPTVHERAIGASGCHPIKKSPDPVVEGNYSNQTFVKDYRFSLVVPVSFLFFSVFITLIR